MGPCTFLCFLCPGLSSRRSVWVSVGVWQPLQAFLNYITEVLYFLFLTGGSFCAIIWLLGYENFLWDPLVFPDKQLPSHIFFFKIILSHSEAIHMHYKTLQDTEKASNLNPTNVNTFVWVSHTKMGSWWFTRLPICRFPFHHCPFLRLCGPQCVTWPPFPSRCPEGGRWECSGFSLSEQGPDKHPGPAPLIRFSEQISRSL